MQVSLSPGPIGAEITGVNLGDLDAAGFDALAGVFLDRGVIVVRDQRLSSQALVALTRRFGTPEVIPVTCTGVGRWAVVPSPSWP